MIIPQIVLNIHDIGTILGETTNKTIIIMYISLLFNKCINYKNIVVLNIYIDTFHYFILFKRSKIVSFSTSARLFPVLRSITSLIISFLFCARSLYIFFYILSLLCLVEVSSFLVSSCLLLSSNLSKFTETCFMMV